MTQLTDHNFRLHFLGSGSKGNATVLECEQALVLIDCGFSRRELFRRMSCLQLDPQQIKGILLSHEHKDHTRAVTLLSREKQITVLATHKTLNAAGFDQKTRCQKHALQAGQSLDIFGLTVTPFSTLHDARDPVGFVFDFPGGQRLGYATDLGEASREVCCALRDCDYLALESNHDPAMLIDGPYPWYLKNRIQSRLGHLSNPDTVRLLQQIAGPRLQHLFAMHLSETNNHPELAQEALEQGLSRMGLDQVPVTVIDQFTPMSFPAKNQLSLW